MTNLVNTTVCKVKNIKEQIIYLPIFDFMNFIILYRYTKSTEHNNHISIIRQIYEIAQEIIKALLNIFIFVSCYYIFACRYNLGHCYDEVVTACNTSLEELKPIKVPSIWYKSIIDDFFNKFTSNYKIIDHNFYKTNTQITLNHNQDIVEKYIILNKIKSHHINSLNLECEFYKNKTSLLEIQLLNTKIAYHNLVKDINDIVKEINYSSKNP